jgi:DNA-binding NtrC family response regulator
LLEGREEFAWPEAETEPMADYFRYRKSPGETRSLAMRVCLDRLRDIAMSGAGVYLQADHLDDPEYFARYVHHHSERAEKRFVFLEARGLSRNLFESAIASAGNGTLYLQSIEAFPQLLQKRLVKVSGFANQGIDLRLICSGEKSLASFLRDGSIVPDLARRMQGSEVFVPPIRMRMEDLIPLSRRILLKYSPDGLSDALQFSPQVLTEFLHYGWPGGLRELRATIHTMLVRRQEHELRLDIKHLPQNFRDREIHPESTHFSGLTIEEAERRLILSTLQKMRGNKKECAKALNIGYNTLWRKLKSYQSKGRGRRSPSTPIA